MYKHIVGLDIGSHSIKAVVADIKKNSQLSILKIIKMPSSGLRRGVIEDLPEATRAINQVVNEVKQVSKNAVKNIYMGISSPDFKIQNSKGIVAVARADSEIHQDDVDRAIEASQAIKLPLNREIVHLITREFVVDDMADVRDPLGMIGNRLEVNSLIIDAFSHNIRNIAKAVENAGGSVSGLFFSPLAASRAALSKNQKELGVVLVDIGFGKTNIAVYEENKLIHTSVFPAGSGNITNDLAIGLKTSIMSADSIKLSLGSALAKDAPAREQIELAKFDSAAKGSVSRRYISEIIEARLAEIFEFINNELKRVGRSAKLPAGVVLVGGGAKLPAMADLAKQELKLSSQVGVPNLSELDTNNLEIMSESEDPELAVVFGLLLSATEQMADARPANSKTGLIRKILGIFAP